MDDVDDGSCRTGGLQLALRSASICVHLHPSAPLCPRPGSRLLATDDISRCAGTLRTNVQDRPVPLIKDVQLCITNSGRLPSRLVLRMYVGTEVCSAFVVAALELYPSARTWSKAPSTSTYSVLYRTWLLWSCGRRVEALMQELVTTQPNQPTVPNPTPHTQAQTPASSSSPGLTSPSPTAAASSPTGRLY